MTRQRAIWLFLMVVLALVLGGRGAPNQPVHAQDVAAWTVMFYSTADTSDIEEPMLIDVNEIEWVGSTDEVNFVAQVDRTDEDPDWTDTRRFLLEQDDDPETVTSPILESLGEVNMGDPAELIDFALWAAENFPAERYAMILSDHGGGWTGIGWDLSDDGDQLTMPELDEAFAQITESLGQPFDLIGFDACLMAQFDVIRMLAPYADYAVLAEETEPGSGWAYDLSLSPLVENPSMDAAELGRQIVDDYFYSYNEGEFAGGEDLFDLNLFELALVPDLEVAFDEFIQVAEAYSDEVLGAIGDARNNTLFFGGRTPDEADAFSSIDLIHFLSLLIDISDNPDLDQAAQNLIDATSNIILHHQASDALSDANGVSIYFPSTASVYEAYGSEYPDEVAYMADWQGFVDLYYSGAAEIAPPGAMSSEDVITIQGVYPGDVVSIHQPPVILFDTNGHDILEVTFSATLETEDGTLITLDESPLESAEVTESGDSIVIFPDGFYEQQFTWGAEMPVVTDGVVGVPTLLLSNRNDPDSQAVSGQYFFQDGDSVTAYLIFDVETRTLTNVWGVSEAGNAPFTIDPEEGDQFLPTWRYLDEEGNDVLEPASSDPLTFGDEPFSYHFEPAVSGSYIFTILVEDIAGNLYIDSTTIEVDNEGLDINYRGYTDVTFGMNFLYPWEWPSPTYVVNDDGSAQTVINDPDESIYIYVTTPEAESSEDMVDFAYFYLDQIEDVSYDPADEEIVTIWGYDGSIIPYSYPGEEETQVGLLLAIYVPDLETGFLVDLDAPESLNEEATAAFDVMVGSMNFFEPPEAETE